VFHPAGALHFRPNFRPPVGFLVVSQPFVGWAPPDLDGDPRPRAAQRADVPLYLEPRLPCGRPMLLSYLSMSTIPDVTSAAPVLTSPSFLADIWWLYGR